MQSKAAQAAFAFLLEVREAAKSSDGHVDDRDAITSEIEGLAALFDGDDADAISVLSDIVFRIFEKYQDRDR